MKPIIYPYKIGSKSARALAKGLGTFCVYPDKNYKPKKSHMIINWGNSLEPKWGPPHDWWLNTSLSINIATNKAKALFCLCGAGVNTVPFTISKMDVIDWLDAGGLVVARTKLQGHSGEGIVLISNKDEYINAPLYTLYKKKKHEYRVHVMNGKVFDVQQKRKRHEKEVDYKVRNYNNGWVYCRENLEIPNDLHQLAIDAVKALKLHFGAVDIIWNRFENKCYVLEINTAPGLEGTTLKNYLQEFKNVIA